MTSAAVCGRFSGIEIGHGTFGTVRYSRDPATGRPLATKSTVTAATKLEQKEVMRVAKREANTYEKLPPHANIATFVGWSTRGDRVDLVLEYAGVTLTQYCQDYGVRSIHVIVDVFRQICAGLAHLHSHGYAHRDLKPDNILVRQTASGPHVRIADFGLARRMNTSLVPEACTPIVQTLWYRAPEVLAHSAYTMTIDSWSAGCILYELATGKPLFPHASEMNMITAIFDEVGPFPLPPEYPAFFHHQHATQRRIRHAETPLGTSLYTMMLRLLDPNPMTRMRSDQASTAMVILAKSLPPPSPPPQPSSPARLSALPLSPAAGTTIPTRTVVVHPQINAVSHTKQNT